MRDRVTFLFDCPVSLRNEKYDRKRKGKKNTTGQSIHSTRGGCNGKVGGNRGRKILRAEGEKGGDLGGELGGVRGELLCLGPGGPEPVLDLALVGVVLHMAGGLDGTHDIRVQPVPQGGGDGVVPRPDLLLQVVLEHELLVPGPGDVVKGLDGRGDALQQLAVGSQDEVEVAVSQAVNEQLPADPGEGLGLHEEDEGEGQLLDQPVQPHKRVHNKLLVKRGQNPAVFLHNHL